MEILQTLFFIFIVGAGIACIANGNKWAALMQKNYMNAAKERGTDDAVWAKGSALVLFKAIIIFIGLVLIIASYPVAFGTVYF